MGVTWLDWVLLVLVLVFAIRGFLRGTVSQIFAVVGLLAGLLAAGWISQWVGEHWRGARPAVVFWVLRWLVAALAGLSLMSLFHWWGGRLGEAVKAGPIGWLDRAGGVVIGAGIGALVIVFVMMFTLVIKRPQELGDTVARARVTVPLMHNAARLCALGDKYFPGSTWLRQRFLAAEKRAVRPSQGGRTSTRT